MPTQTYCSGQEKAVLILKYPTHGNERIESENTPLTFITSTNGIPSDVMRLSYDIYLNGVYAFRNTIDYYKPPDFDEGWTPETALIRDGETCSGSYQFWDYFLYLSNGGGSVGCGVKSGQSKYNSLVQVAFTEPSVNNFSVELFQCTVQVKDGLDNTLWNQTLNECPDVESYCQDCPPDTIKCKSDKWPGYCCVSCSEIAGEIASIDALVRNLS